MNETEEKDALRVAANAWRSSNPEVKGLTAHAERELRWLLRTLATPPLTEEAVRSLSAPLLREGLRQRSEKIAAVLERTELRREALADAQKILLRFGLAALPYLIG